MDKAYHPCYTNLNPVEEVRKYIPSLRVYCRKETLMYDWLDAHRDVNSWLRKVPYHLERGSKEKSWVVKYFEYRSGVPPVPQAGFIGDLWISWNVQDPSVWFKVDETKWERWGGCASSVREQMSAKHPFLDKTFLWFDPKNYFFLDRLPDGRPLLRWKRSSTIRRVAPATRIVDQDQPSNVAGKPVYLPSMRVLVRAMCPQMAQTIPAPRRTPTTSPVVDREEGYSNSGEAGMATATATATGAGAGTVKFEGPQGPFSMEDINIGSDVEIDWNWWGDTGDEAEEGATQVGNSQPQHLNFTPTPTPVTPVNSSRYHPYRPNVSPTTPFIKFKPPRRYALGVFDSHASSSSNLLYNTPVSSPGSTTSTVVNPTTNPVSADDKETVDPQEQEVSPQREVTSLQKPSRRTLEGIVRILREAGHDHSGIWVFFPPELRDVREELAANLPVPTLDLELQTSYKIRDLLDQDGFVQRGILLLNMQVPMRTTERTTLGPMGRRNTSYL